MTLLLLVGALAVAPQPRLGATVRVVEPTQGTVVSVVGDVVVESEVDGDVVALAGGVTLAAGARVSGDVVAVGGSVAGPGRVEGRVVAIAAGPSWPGGEVASDPALRWGLQLLRLGVWVSLAAVLLLLAPRPLRQCGERLAARPLRTALAGLAALVAWFSLLLLAVAASSSPLGVAVMLIGVAALLAVKAFGLVAVVWALGRSLYPVLPRPLRGEVPRTVVAMAAGVLLALVPAVGTLVWMVLSALGIGAVAGCLGAPAPAPVRAAVR